MKADQADPVVRPSGEFQVEVPDLDYWKRLINCQHACPVHTDSRGYVRAIAEGQDELSYLIARGPNPLASVCGRVCGAPCEEACRRGDIDQPISIRALKRFVCDQLGPEARDEGGRGLIEFLKEAAGRLPERPNQDVDELLQLLRATLDKSIVPVEGKSVGIIGSGPAGLAAAHDLLLLGFGVTLYEIEEVLGGMLTVGIPEYRLPRDLIQAEIQVIEELGAQAETGCEVGKDVTLAELRERHDAVIIAVGLKRSRKLDLPGSDASGVLGGVEYLRDACLGRPPTLGHSVVVIGGGNVAYDVGRTALRQIASDAARTALRDSGVTAVHLCSLESLEEMPADDVEIREGDEEGVLRENGWAPMEILKDDDGRVSGVRFKRCLQVYDENRRFSPKFDEGVQKTLECDTVLLSIGQSVDLAFVDPERDGLPLTNRGALECDAMSGRTAHDDVFVAGDLARGPGLIIHAIASGKAVARAIYETVSGRALQFDATTVHLSLPEYQREKGYEGRARQAIPVASLAERLRSRRAQVEVGYDEPLARREAGRCLDCGVNTIFDGEKCILCGGCVDVCPELCLRIVSVDRLAREGQVAEVVDRLLADTPPEDASAILKDETRCIRCALCAERCPTGAITMERMHFTEVPSCQND